LQNRYIILTFILDKYVYQFCYFVVLIKFIRWTLHSIIQYFPHTTDDGPCIVLEILLIILNWLKKCIIQYYWTSICILGIYCKFRVLQHQKVEALNCVGGGGHFNWGYVFRMLVQMPNLPNIIKIALSYF
jgi:hypothetical protein